MGWNYEGVVLSSVYSSYSVFLLSRIRFIGHKVGLCSLMISWPVFLGDLNAALSRLSYRPLKRECHNQARRVCQMNGSSEALSGR